MEFFEALKQVGVFLIIGQTILHFRPAKKYEKYMKMMISMMVMSQLMIPIFSIFNQDMEAVMKNELDKYMEELNEFEQQQTLLEEEMLENSRLEYELFEGEISAGLYEILPQEELGVEEEDVQLQENENIDHKTEGDIESSEEVDGGDIEEETEQIEAVEIEKIEVHLDFIE